jgi:predicted nucleic acid-binding protein
MINMRMISKVFVDTNVFVAIRDTTDTTHTRAIKILEYLRNHKVKWCTSSDVIGETLTVMSKKLGKAICVDWYKDFRNSRIEEIFVDENLHKEARSAFKQVKSKNTSFIDCSSMVAMKRNNIKYIFSFDEDFKKLGIKLVEDVV